MVELDKYLPIDKEYQFRGGVNENFAKIERGFSQRDGIMANHKTDEKNAHNSGQIKHFLWDVKQHLDYLTAQSANIVRGANGDGIAETVDSRVAAFSKFTHVTLSERLLEDFLYLNKALVDIKNEVDENKEDFNEIEFRFEPEIQDFQYLTDLSPFKNAVMQSFYIENRSEEIYMTQATDEGYRLSRHAMNGQEIDFMLCDGGGHGTHNGYRWIGDSFWIYSSYTNGNGKPVVVRFKYKAGITQTYGTNGMEDVYTGRVDNSYATPMINEKEESILYRFSGYKANGDLFNWIEIRNLSDVDKNINKIIHSVEIPTELTTNEQPMQGVAYADGVLYWYTGNASLDTPNYLTAFSLITGKELYRRRVTIGVKNGTAPGESAEAEGMQFYYDSENGRHALLLGVTVGPFLDRQHEIHGIFQNGLYEKLKGQIMPFRLSDSGGRRKPLPFVTTKLSDYNSPGSYYLSTALSHTFIDMPIPSRWYPSGWLFEVDYSNYGGDVKQTITRNTFQTNPFSFFRMVGKNSVGPWVYVGTTVNGSGDRIPTTVVNLSELNVPGMKFYMTSDDSKRIKDFPRNDGVAGWWIDIGMTDSEGGFMQTVKRSSSNETEIYMRTISSTGVSNRWSIIKAALV